MKVVHSNLVHDEEFISRFHRESQVSASLDHPNIVTVYDEGQDDDVHYMAMQYWEGKDCRFPLCNRCEMMPFVPFNKLKLFELQY